MEENSRVPAIRFLGFTDAWEQRKLGDVYDFSKGKGLPLDSFYEGKNSPAIAYGHLYTKYAEVISEVNLSSNDEAILSKKGDILFPGSSTVPYGTAQSNAIMLDNIKLGGDVIVARAKEKMPFAPFVSYQINAQKEKLFPITVGTTITHMYGKDIKNIEYFFTNVNEQEQIGTLFSNLDNLITLHQCKYDKLKNIKTALLEKMFPTEGEETPKIRFKGFTDAWEQCKFGDMVSINRGLTYSPLNIRKNGIRVLRSSNINEDTFIKYDDDVFVEKDAVNIPLVENGDILITAANGSSRLVGKHAIINGLRSNSAVHGGFMLLAKTRNPYFINASMSSSWYEKFINLHVSGGNGAIGNLSKKNFDDYDIFVPSIGEQAKIGELFYQLDNLITLHQHKCFNLNLTKVS